MTKEISLREKDRDRGDKETETPGTFKNGKKDDKFSLLGKLREWKMSRRRDLPN